tara:strand:+ start:112 stop:561 length:450 start_codon:yes stop_codon:yes gene_type:complete
LLKSGHGHNVIELKDTARSAADAATALDVPVGAIVKTLVFIISDNNHNTPVIALVAGDKQCRTDMLPRVLGCCGEVIRPRADIVKEITGYSIGGVSPLGLPEKLDVILDASLKRFETIWSAAGHTHCVFPATFVQLANMTKSIESDQIT